MNRTRHRHKPLGSFIEQPKFRPEVQGLRSLAVLLVVMYHVWFGKVSGGVDVFLFISAFLLSLSSLRKIQDGKPLKVVSYWLHVFQRLLPAAATVILATLVAAYFVIAPSRWASLLADAKAALFYFLNWRLAFNSVDYYAQDATLKTPFQHFWSLSMQGQIFILWPLLFAFVAFLVGYLRLKVLPTALFVFGTVFVTSLTFSIIETSTNQSFAYFDTRTRLWEFAAGTLLAMLVLAWRVPSWLKVPMGWVGVIGLVTCGWLLPVERAFPGYLALWPLLSAAFVIAAGQTGSPWGADRLLSARPLQKLGAISYCLYLVHWPILILYTTAIGEPKAGWFDGTLIILLSIAAAWALHHLVEKPLRAWDRKPSRRLLRHIQESKAPWTGQKQDGRPSWARPLTVIATCLALIGGSVTAGQVWVRYQQEQAEELALLAGTAAYPGALAAGSNQLYRNLPIPQGDILTQFDSLSQQCASYGANINPDLTDYCSIDYWGDEDAPLTIVVGDSHAEQAISMYRPLAEANRQNMMAFLKGGCKFPTQPQDWAECADFNRNLTQEILDLKPTNLLLMGTAASPTDANETLIDGLEKTVETFTAAGINVIALRDNPRYDYNMYVCGQLNLRKLSNCSMPVSQKLAPVNPSLALGEFNPRVYTVDLTEQICPKGMCRPVEGNVFIYIDDNHLSKAYGSTMASEMERQLLAQGWDPSAP
ncbi:acyltransferase family protein [Rothia nasimurium]|uniref:acyltransferase family protein n=1 Tax=Rothia nasimurium TaxID=85336 RepID=UPI00361BCB78